jgi:hypothetical protein
MATITYDGPGEWTFPLAGRSNVKFFAWAPGANGSEEGDMGGGAGSYMEGTYTDTTLGETAISIVILAAGPGAADCRITCFDGDGAGAGSICDSGQTGDSGGTGGTVVSDDHNWTTLQRSGGNGHADGGGGASGGPDDDGASASGATGASGAGSGGGSGGDLGANGVYPGGAGGGQGGLGAEGKAIFTWDEPEPEPEAQASVGYWRNLLGKGQGGF